MKKIEILTVGRGFGGGTTISIDGEPLQDVRTIEIVIESGELTRLAVTRFVRAEGGFLLEEDEQGQKRLVATVQEFTFSGSLQLVGAPLSEESRVLL